MTVKEEMKLKTDIQIAQEAQMLPIREVAERAGIAEEDLEFYGKYKAKLIGRILGSVSKTIRMESLSL